MLGVFSLVKARKSIRIYHFVTIQSVKHEQIFLNIKHWRQIIKQPDSERHFMAERACKPP